MPWKIILPVILVIAGVSGYVVYSSFQSPYQPAGMVESAPEPVAVIAEPEPVAPEAVQSSVEAAEPEPGVAEAEEELPPSEEPEASEEPQESAPEPVAAGPGIVEPPQWLSGSDAQVRKAAADLEEALVSWLVPDEQLRKWVLMVDQLAEGKLPIKHRPVTYPVDRFLVYQEGDQMFQDGGNFSRWTPLVDAVTAIDPALLAAYYRRWLPLMEQAYDELGKSNSFDQRFRQLLDQMVYAKLAPENAPLVRPHIFYQYADPELEAASPLEKWLWRMGEENMLRLQGFLRDFKGELS